MNRVSEEEVEEERMSSSWVHLVEERSSHLKERGRESDEGQFDSPRRGRKNDATNISGNVTCRERERRKEDGSSSE